MSDSMSVLLVTEGTYPYYQGGVSQWCDILLKRLKDVDYKVFSIVVDPFVTQKFDLPKGTQLIRVPLWGTEEPSEHLDTPFSLTYLAKQRTTDEAIESKFIPLFRDLILELISSKKNSYSFAQTIVELYDLFMYYDYKVCFKSELTWNAYKNMIQDVLKDSEYGLAEPDVYCLIQSLGWVYRFFNIINTEVPETHVTHASAASFCGLPCVIAKIKRGTPFLLTEHGVYLREQYLSLSKRGYPSFLNTFLIRMIHSVTDLSYTFADQISPVCEYNTRWERQLTGRHERIRVIYNGVDHEIFSDIQHNLHHRPTVVAVSRIDPIKDIMTLQRTAYEVKKKIPNVHFIVYGSVSVPEYYEECKNLNVELGLEETFEFAGHISDIPRAYESADIIAQASVSEAFPYSIIEAMFAGKPIISTDVGGIPEALGDCGLLVTPGDVEAMSKGILQLIHDKALANEFAAQARTRALNLFTLDKSLEQYLKSYLKLCLVPEEMGNREFAYAEGLAENHTVDGQQILAERGFAFADIGDWHRAAQLLMDAIMLDPVSHVSTVLWIEVAKIHEKLGRFDLVEQSLRKSDEVNANASKGAQRLAIERAYAFRDIGMYKDSVQWLEAALASWPNSPVGPILSLDLADLYKEEGDLEQADLWKLKFDLLVDLLEM